MTTAEEATWLVVTAFRGPLGLNDDRLANAITAQIMSEIGDSDVEKDVDVIIGNLLGDAKGSLDDAYDAARGYLQASIVGGVR